MTEKRGIDLNADIGEHDGDRYEEDRAILALISSANIACGAHAGSREVMRQTVRTALERGVSVGAHPGYPDRAGFGRREIGLSPSEIRDSFEGQITAMIGCCEAESARLRYVKPHGALYNRASREAELADLLATCVVEVDSSLVMLALSGSELERSARSHGLRVAREAFIDRAYTADGQLVARDQPGAVIHDPAAAAERAVQMVTQGTLLSASGEVVSVAAESLCVHGDSANALEIVRLARARIESAGFTVTPFA